MLLCETSLTILLVLPFNTDLFASSWKMLPAHANIPFYYDSCIYNALYQFIHVANKPHKKQGTDAGNYMNLMRLAAKINMRKSSQPCFQREMLVAP